MDRLVLLPYKGSYWEFKARVELVKVLGGKTRGHPIYPKGIVFFIEEPLGEEDKELLGLIPWE